MGSLCSSCFGSDNDEDQENITPDPEVRRQQQLDAVEKRLQNQENRGIKNPSRVQRMQKKAEEKDRLQEQVATRYDGKEGGLRWQMN